ncbi:MAG: hypothetical protein KA603_00160 [Azonexus sp.]|nr:hypothetical protein [Azonexus sp.]MBP6905074.1 hypothetical protein [Azonexus sp.]
MLLPLSAAMAHQVIVGVAENVVAVGAVLGKVERLVLEDRNQAGQPVDDFLTAAELARIVEVGHVRQLVGVRQWSDDLLVDLMPMSDLPLSATMSLKLAPSGMVIGA